MRLPILISACAALLTTQVQAEDGPIQKAQTTLEIAQKKLQDLLATDGRHDEEYKRKVKEYCKMSDDERYQNGLHKTLLEGEDKWRIKWINEEPHYMTDIRKEGEKYVQEYVCVKDFKSVTECKVIDEYGREVTDEKSKKTAKKEIRRFCKKVLDTSFWKYTPVIWPSRLLEDKGVSEAHSQGFNANYAQLKRLSELFGIDFYY